MSELVPKLRFGGFVKPWYSRELGSVTSFKSGNTPSKSDDEFWNGDIPWISASSMYGVQFSDSNNKITTKALSVAKVAPKGSLLLLVRGSMLFNKIPVGIATRDLAFNQDVKSINLINQQSNLFLLLWFQSNSNRLLNMVTGTGIGAGKLDTDELQSLPYVFPEIQEQQKIADFLTSVDIKISQLTEKHRLLKEYKKGVMQQIFSQKIRFKDENGEAFPEWEVKRLGQLGSFLGGGTPSTENDFFWSGDIPWVSSSDLQDEKLFSINISRYINMSAIRNSATKIIPQNSLLIVSRVGIGKFAVCKQEICTSQDFTNFTPHDSDVIFMAYLLLNNRKKLLSLGQGTTIKGFTISDLSSLKLDIPSIQEQQKIAQYLQSIDAKIDAVNQQIEDTKLFKKGLLQQMFV
ncbi:restriction endonuclease subunit S [Vibrio algivorus]|uniref:Restriction endonuclease subunit S n=1 Tax=Vibrio algivorus TaxID=1667024 RepID=A0A557PC01_9VIBR|nr:restriction endonuclease subunit S [Vibrio algivorus]TVO38189.1 restriction endonuclease subunit S [Vibrio algivorus]